MNVMATRTSAATSAGRFAGRSRGKLAPGLPTWRRFAALALTGLAIGAALAAAALADPGAQTAATDPDGARGYEQAPGHGVQRGLLLAPRLLLLPLRVGLNVATFPVRVAAGALSSSGLPERTARGFRADRYFTPVAFVDPDPGLNFGFRAGHHNPLDDQGCVTYRAAWGGTKWQVYALTLRSRDLRHPGWTYRVTGKWEIIPNHNYFGIGNSTLYGNRTYYTSEKYLLLATLGRTLNPWTRLNLNLSHHRCLISHAAYVEAPDKSIEERFPSEASAPGYRLDPQNYWAELALTLDHRDRPGRTTAGWMAEGYAGYAMGAGLDAADYWRYGAEASGYVPLAQGQTLTLRAAGEEARTSSDEPIKITELMSLGGRSSLRGYVEDRFLDNASVMWTAEYRYQIAPFAQASLFADFGKVMPRLLDFNLDDIHRSFGGGLQFAIDEQFLFRLEMAKSDETYVLIGTLEPVFEREDRRDRR